MIYWVHLRIRKNESATAQFWLIRMGLFFRVFKESEYNDGGLLEGPSGRQ